LFTGVKGSFICQMLWQINNIQAALIIYVRSFYLQFCIYGSEKWPFSGTYPLIYNNPWCFYMQFCYMRPYFWSTYLSHITKVHLDYQRYAKEKVWKPYHTALLEKIKFLILDQFFQPFSHQKFVIIWRSLNASYSTLFSIFREPSKELAEPLCSAEPRLKNTDLDTATWLKLFVLESR